MGGTGNSMCKASDMGPSLVGVRKPSDVGTQGGCEVSGPESCCGGGNRKDGSRSHFPRDLVGRRDPGSPQVGGWTSQAGSGRGLGWWPRRNATGLESGLLLPAGRSERPLGPDGKVAKGWVWGRRGSQVRHGSRGLEFWGGAGARGRTEAGQCGAGLQTPIPGAWLAGRRPWAPSAPGRDCDSPVSHPQPSELCAWPREAGNVRPQGRAQPAGRQAGRPPAVCPLHAAAAAPGKGRAGPGGAGRVGTAPGRPGEPELQGCIRLQDGGRPTPAPPAAPGLCLLRFLASERALLLLFSDGTLQVSAGARVLRLCGALCGGVGGHRQLWWGWG